MKNKKEKMKIVKCRLCGQPVFDWSKHIICDVVDVADFNLSTPKGIKIREWFATGFTAL